MKTLPDFLEKFNFSQSDFESTGLDWKKLIKIKEDYENFIPELIPPAHYIIEILHNVKMVHSVRFRIKKPFHLLAKIVRKKLEEPDRIIDISNYKDEITDLIGLRVLHLFKEDWLSIHNFINKTWSLKEKPIAYYREGDKSDYIKKFKENGCDDEEHPFGYRSVHYLITTNPSKIVFIVEIQVRTIFEEAWSEIDHTVRYPNDINNQILSQFSVILNRLAGSADEMGSFVQYLKSELALMDSNFKKDIDKKVKMINDLKEEVKKLQLKPKDSLKWVNNLDEMLNEIIKVPDYSKITFPKLPDYSKITFPKVPDYSKITFPKLPDYSKITFPKVPDTEDIVSAKKPKTVRKKSIKKKDK